jgi:uncharacterized membrane protein YdjX (TVP38/TMEM64 family)
METINIDFKTKIRFLMFILIILTIIISAIYFDISSYISQDILNNWISQFGVYGPLVFIGIYTLAIIFIIPVTLLAIIGGVLFGIIFGTIYVIIGSLLGAIICYYISKIFGKHFIQQIIDLKFQKLKIYNDNLEHHGLITVFFLRIIPISPFAALNYAFGVTKVKDYNYIIGTFFGIIPSSLVLVYLGNSISNWSIINIIVSSLLYILLILSYPLYKMWHKRHKRIIGVRMPKTE